jgi:ABC-2 type transport system ATP-binding protein
VVLTTHYLEEAERLSDRVAILDQGEIAALDSPAALVGSSGLAGTIVFTFESEIPGLAERVAAFFPGATANGTGARVSSVRLEDDLHRILELGRAAGTSVRDLAVHAPTLEDVYLSRTGHAWPGEESAVEVR